MALHNFRGSHDKIQVQTLHSLSCANHQQNQDSLAIRTFIAKDHEAPRHQARPHSCDAADPNRRNDRGLRRAPVTDGTTIWRQLSVIGDGSNNFRSSSESRHNIALQ